MVVAEAVSPSGRSRRGLDLLPTGLAALSRRASGSGDGGSEDGESERVLRAAVEALLALARRIPGFDVTVTVNQAPIRAVRVHYTNEGLVAHRLNVRGRASGREDVAPVLNESEVVSELATMLLAGEVEPR